MQTFHKIINTPLDSQYVFRVPTQKRGDVYMRALRSNYSNHGRAVVEVDAERFLALWRGKNGSHPEVAHGTPITWPLDYKFKDAEAGFAKGETNPVTLAEVNFNTWTAEVPVWHRRLWLLKELERIDFVVKTGLGFTNGVTRTIWLLTAGAKVFPVECGMQGAEELQREAGIAGGRIYTVKELLRASVSPTFSTQASPDLPFRPASPSLSY